LWYPLKKEVNFFSYTCPLVEGQSFFQVLNAERTEAVAVVLDGTAGQAHELFIVPTDSPKFSIIMGTLFYTFRDCG